jgi:ribonucleotide monophosphatase NagD (HAD superfamily)
VTEAALALCAARGVPMICANPDLHVTLPDGTRGHMPGLLAEAYEAMGGHVVFFGKPHKQGFDECLALLPEATDPARVLHVGDSLAHDVAGANRAGLDSLFVAAGIHSGELRALASRVDETVSDECDMQTSARWTSDMEISSDILERLFQANDGQRPTYTIAQFRW